MYVFLGKEIRKQFQSLKREPIIFGGESATQIQTTNFNTFLLSVYVTNTMEKEQNVIGIYKQTTCQVSLEK